MILSQLFQTPPFPRHRFPLLGLALAALLGIWIADIWHPNLWILTTFALLAASAPWLPKGTTNYWPLLATALAFAAVHEIQTRDPFAESIRPKLRSHQRLLTELRGSVIEIRPANERTRPIVIATESLRFGLNGEWQTLPHEKVLIWLPAELPIQESWQIQVLGSLQEIDGPRNPGIFDKKAWWFRRGVQLEMRLNHPSDVRVLVETKPSAFGASISYLRGEIRRLLSIGITDSPETMSILNGIMLGDLSDAPEEWLDEVRTSGLMHLFAVSGLNVGMIAAIGWVLVAMLPIPRGISAALVFGLVLIYAALAGFSASVFRATIMAGAIIFALVSGRRAFLVNSIAGAALIILLCDTNELYQIGFQLSFFVVLSIALFASPMTPALEKRLMPDPFIPRRLYNLRQRISAWSANSFAAAAAATFAAWLASLPLIMLHFHMVSPIALLVNLPAVPIGFLLLAFALLALVGGMIFVPIAGVFNNASWAVAQLLLGLVTFANSFPGGHWFAAIPSLHNKNYLCNLTVYSLENGQSILIETLEGAWLVNCGTEANVRYVLEPSLHAKGINRLNGIIFTHTDREHTGGQELLRKIFQPRNEISGDEMFSPLTLARHVALEAFTLVPPAHSRTGDDRSTPLSLQAGKWKILLLDEAGFAREAQLLGLPRPGNPDIIIRDENEADPGDSKMFVETFPAKLTIQPGGQFDTKRDGAIQIEVEQEILKAGAFSTGKSVILSN